MGSLHRGLRNLSRSRGRAVLVIVILGLSVGVFLTMVQTSSGIEGQAQVLRRQVETVIEVRPLDSPMALVTDTPLPLPADAAERIQAIPNVARVDKYVRFLILEKNQPVYINKVILSGMEENAPLRVSTHGQFVVTTIDAGRGSFQGEDTQRNVAIVGRVFAARWQLNVGDTFPIGAAFRLSLGEKRVDLANSPVGEFQVVGIFSSGFFFGDNQIFLPYDLMRQAFGRILNATVPNFSNIFATVNSVDNVGQVATDMKAAFQGPEGGNPVADVVSGREAAELAAQALGLIGATSTLAGLLSLIVGGLVILFTMILVTRQRTKEIGILKAIGASNRDVGKDFLVEAMALGVISGLAGLIVLTAAGPAIALLILNPLGSRLTGFLPALGTGHENVAPALISQIGFLPNLTLIGYAFAVSLVFGTIGSLYAVARAIRLRPAEGLRFE